MQDRNVQDRAAQMASESESLDPARLTPAASLNRVRFTALSGLQIPPGMIDWAAYALLSGRALANLTARHGAHEAARTFGTRLGWLLVTLRLGDPASRAARPDWDDSYWRHWAGVQTVFLGGGIVGGEVGPRIAEQAARVLAEAGMSDCRVLVAPWQEHLPLLGAARSVAVDSGAPPGSAVVFDFGQSYIKRGFVRYEDGALASLRILPRRPARWVETPAGADPPAEQTRALADDMVEAMAETWRAGHTADPSVSTTIVASIAAYVRDGQPLARQGGAYSYLRLLSDDLEGWLADRLSGALGQAVRVRLLHDGTAGARALAGEQQAAVIVLGTALGVGFPPAPTETTPLAPDFGLAGSGA